MRHARFARRVNLSHPARLRRRANQWPQSARLVPTRGAYRDRHGRWARDAMDALLRETSAATRTAKSCGPDLPTLGSSLCVTSAQATVAKKPGTPRRARISRQTNRAGNAGCFGVPVVTCLRAFFHCTQGCGCVSASGISLRPLSFEGRLRKARARIARLLAHVGDLGNLRKINWIVLLQDRRNRIVK